MRLVYTDNDFYVIIYEWDFPFDRHPNGSHVRISAYIYIQFCDDGNPVG